MSGQTYYIENVHSPSEPEDGIADIHCILGTGITYRGHKNTTNEGLQCQNWSSKKPHRHSLTKEYPGLGEAENYCRNPDNRPRGPWCYTMDPEVEFQYCGVPTCEDPEDKKYKCSEHRGLNYKGNVTRALSGATCANNLLKEYTLVNCIKQTGATYAGERSAPYSADERFDYCVPWDVDHPQMFPYNLYMGHHNYCRNPDGSEGIWCFVWKGSDIERKSCGNDILQCSSDWMVELKFTRLNVCSRFIHDGLAEDGPWCYTEEGKREFCDVPTCEDEIF